jgi:hypothetical protein
LIQHYIQGAWTQNSTIHIQHLTKDILDLQAAHLSTNSLDSMKSWLDKLNPNHWFNFGLKELIGIGGFMLLSLLSITWLKRLITRETNCHKKEKFLNALFIKNKKGGDVGNPQDPQSLERSGVTGAFVQQP